MMRLRCLKWWFVAALFALLSEPALLACTACFGKSDSNMAKGMNMGILALLFVITTVLVGIAAFFVFVAKRTTELENGQGPEALSTNQSHV